MSEDLNREGLKALYEKALSFLYTDEGPTKYSLKEYNKIENLFELKEKVVLRWLITRTTGRLKNEYGVKAITAARESRYRCKSCGYPDVRALHLDHIQGKIEDADFDCLCANCHNIKSRKYDWTGKPR
ncbi:hypothetical protein [Saccharibacillus qingshengii]|uniref:hypothetical protein n=1 Tax=Saccharibacillus qingshengii TaxID=1763540 RepID=UPI001555849B|nr:hypothetical protein [Saccharibacillus qingshengii]